MGIDLFAQTNFSNAEDKYVLGNSILDLSDCKKNYEHSKVRKKNPHMSFIQPSIGILENCYHKFMIKRNCAVDIKFLQGESRHIYLECQVSFF